MASEESPQNRVASVAECVADARDRLLDLTLRNRLINFRTTSKKALRIVTQSPALLYSQLVLEERALTAAGREIGEESPPDELGGPVLRDPGDVPDGPMSAAASGGPTATEENHPQARLLIDLAVDELPGRLFRIATEAHAVLEEQGYTVLYLAMGFLLWKESVASTQVRVAPLILVPVELTRGKARSRYTIRWTGEDIEPNLSLVHKMGELGVDCPKFEAAEHPECVAEYVARVRDSVSGRDGWGVVEDSYLGFFSFTKFAMYKDLDPAGWPAGEGPDTHLLVRKLFAPEESKEPSDTFPEEEVDDLLDWAKARYILDADPSQIAAIEDAKRMRDLVVEGPPGTGKSQTIANMIGELLVQGRTVLFVSEKMAALEVVKARLDGLGLGDFCLELHSRKAVRSEVLAELERCLTADSGDHPRADEERRAALKEQIGNLDAYAGALRAPYGAMLFSPYQLLEIRERALRHFASRGRAAPGHCLDPEDEWTGARLEKAVEALLGLSDRLQILGPSDTNPWRDCRPALLLPRDVERIRGYLKDASAAAEALQVMGDGLSNATGISRMKSIARAANAREALKLLSESPELPAKNLLAEPWLVEARSIRGDLEAVDALREVRVSVESIFTAGGLGANVKSLLVELIAVGSGPLRFFSRRYRAAARSASLLYKRRPSLGYRGFLDDLIVLTRFQDLAEKNAEREAAMVRRFGQMWVGGASDVARLLRVAEWAARFQQALGAGVFDERAASFAEAPLSLRAVDATVCAAEVTASELGGYIMRLLCELACCEEAAFGAKSADAELDTLRKRLARWEDQLELLAQWSQYLAARTNPDLACVADLVVLMEQGQLPADDIRPCLQLCIAERELQRAFEKRPALARFVGRLHESAISRYRELDRQIIRDNRELVGATLRARRPQLRGGAPRESQAGILQREINKKKRHIPLRRLMTEAGDLVQQIKPCFMMSPLSIAQFLDPRSVRFDVVIFDEASQVRPEDALGALLRGRQLVVMGDTKQLPPTCFFDHIVEDDEDDEKNDSVGDVESILHLCRRSFPSRMLRWHYRSRHESLIAVSNQEFYNNRLVVYPSPTWVRDGLGLRFVHLPDTVYDRGRSAQNREEARAVAAAVLRHFQTTPARTLGVGAFSAKQQEAIIEEVERLADNHPELEPHLSGRQEGHFFVKNLETIQGDERDVIFLSVGYGFDADRKLWRNFGPLNQNGGERRLNVLITRAREQCTVFCNFRADDLRLEPGAPNGLRALHTFLRYAETGELLAAHETGRDSDSPFEDSVAEYLRGEGYDVSQQVGSAGYRIDLAIVDKRAPGRFLLGIECDGAKYHSARVARERDRLRQEMLEKLGWTIHRVWSVDWYTQRYEAQRQLLVAIERTATLPAETLCGHPDGPDRAHVESSTSAAAAGSARRPPSAGARVSESLPELRGSPYEECAALGIPPVGEIPDIPRLALARAVCAVVDVESPIHISETIRRVRALWGLKRSGQRIAEAVTRAIAYADREGTLSKRGSFLWAPGTASISPRYRTQREHLKIELICDEEIAATVRVALEHQFASTRDAIQTTVARCLGFHQTSAQIRDRIDEVVTQLVAAGDLVERPNGMLDLAKRNGT